MSSANRQSTFKKRSAQNNNKIYNRDKKHFGKTSHTRDKNQNKVSLKAVESLKNENPEKIVVGLFDTKFALDNYLNVDRMGEKLVHDLTFTFLKSFECNSMPVKLKELSKKIVDSSFFNKIVYNSINEKIIDSYNINLIQLVLKLLIEIVLADENCIYSIGPMRDRLELLITNRIQNVELKSLFDDFLKVEEKIKEKKLKQINKTFGNIEDENAEPDEDFTTMSIVPALSDIFNSQEIFLRKNITNGSYKNVNHYLDVQFRLLREDFMRPLREGICEFKDIVHRYKKGSQLTKEILKKIKKIQYLNTYFDVKCTKVETSNQGIVYEMKLDIEKIKSINWEMSKRLIYGSLVCFSSDYFEHECLIGIVSERDEKSLKKNGCFNIKFDFQEDLIIKYPEFGNNYIMLETSAFFESYKHVLKAFQSFKREGEENFPFKENLVYCENTVMPIPKYLKEACVDFTTLVVNSPKNKRNIAKCFISNYGSWPSVEQMNLDQSQYDAIRLALTSKLALIQGPPGTGKTFLGVKLVKFLLDNKHSWWNRPNERKKPILMVCYTNHALDQFLEYCINECKLKQGVIRVGGRCKTENLQPFLLKNIKQNLRNNRSIEKSIYYSIRNQLNRLSEIKRNLSYISKELELIFNQNSILTLEQLNDYIKLHHLNQLFEFSRFKNAEYCLIEWLGLLDFDKDDFVDQFESLDLSGDDSEDEPIVDDLRQGLNSGEDLEQSNMNEPDIEYEQDTSNEERILDDNFIEKETEINIKYELNGLIKKKELFELIQKLKKRIGYINEKWKTKMGKKIVDTDLIKFETVLNKIFTQASYHYTRSPIDVELIENCENIWRLDYQQRYLLYFSWLEKYKSQSEEKIKALNNNYNKEVNILQELRLQEDRSIMENAYIIAMTTTGSSRYHTLLKDIGPRIIIVEEAAEVFEAHIVSSLSKHCEHLILIGDHVQLRPNPAVYTLATKYNLDVSLFERLLNNDTKKVMLKNQHRMRPEISVLMKHFYEEKIHNNDSVYSFPSIKGLKKNIFFINHNKLEKASSDNTTKLNIYEAEYLAKLSLYLKKQGYGESKITVLTMYLGQSSEIRKQLRSLKLNSIKVSTVDNYQGEENEIILLSLVRSNLDNKIGFLNINNRVCVALSRAKHGLFVIGNFEFIAKAEKHDIWKKLVESIKSDDCFGNSLSLTCFSHPENDMEVFEPRDFDKRPDGGCSLPCDFRLECGHVCALRCHGNFDQQHTIYKCLKRCGKKIERCGHLCNQTCSKNHQCSKCSVRVEKQIQECGHIVMLRCDTKPERIYCEMPCDNVLSCGHKCTKSCRVLDCGECLTKICVYSPCIHHSNLIVNCSDPKWTYATKCDEPCNEILDCGHLCSGTCGSCFGGQLHQSCMNKCDRVLFCGHKCSVPCSKQCEPCKKKCNNECQHSKCNKLCSDPCVDCIEKCINSCQHSKCTKLCHELCDRIPCDEPCDKKLKCGHECIGLCGEKCPPWCRICHKDKVSELFFGNEDEDNARFIYLKNCKHLVEVEGMDYWINSRYTNENSNSSNSIQLPECPKCKNPIKGTKRYINVIKTQLKAINKIKLKHYGDENQNRQILSEIREEIKNSKLSEYELNYNESFVIKNLKKILHNEHLSFNSLATIRNTWNIYLKIKQIQNKMIENGIDQLSDQERHIEFEIENIFSSLKSKQNELLLLKDGQKLIDIDNQLKRISSIVELERMRKLILKHPNISQNAFMLMSELDNLLINRVIRYDKIEERIINTFNTLAPLLRTEITKEEKLMIVKAIGLSSGHWFTCPNGHVYCIGECGGAMEKSKCPECKAVIGGNNHQLVRGNKLASQMDGATRPAWPTSLDY